MEKIVEQTLLFDFYGELLTDHQKQIYTDAVFNDLTLSEIADDFGISRQGVYDMIRRINKILTGYENKLHLIEKFLTTKEKVEKIKELSADYVITNNIDKVHQIQKLAQDIIDDF